MHTARLRRNAAILLSAAVVLSGCSGFDQDTPLDQTGASESELQKAKQASREATAGVFTEGESDCVIDKLFTRPDITARQVVDYAEQPDPSSPVQAVYEEVMPQCLDPNANVPPQEVTPELRQAYINGIKSGDPSITDEQAECLFDNLLAQGLTPRDLTVAGYDEQLFASKVDPLLPAAGEACFAGS